MQETWRQRFDPWWGAGGEGKIPWSRKWQPTPVFLPGEFYGQRRLVGYSLWGRKELGMTEWLNMYVKIWPCIFFYKALGYSPMASQICSLWNWFSGQYYLSRVYKKPAIFLEKHLQCSWSTWTFKNEWIWFHLHNSLEKAKLCKQ